MKWNSNNENLNYTSEDIENIFSIIYDNKLYIFWQEKIPISSNSYRWICRYKYYDGEKWNSNGSLNYDNSKYASRPNSAIFNNTLFVIWSEYNGTAQQIRYKYYNSGKWNNDSGSLNYDTSKGADYPNSIIFDNKLYVFWTENYKLRYKYYDGVKWNIDDNSLNYGTTNTISFINTIIFNNNLYVFWSEDNTKLRYKYYNGVEWNNDNSSLNYDMSKNVKNLNITIYSDKLYLFWGEYNEADIWQLRYKYYDGIKWYDYNDSLNYDVSKHIDYPNNIVFNNELYAFWSERNGSINEIRYKYYDGIKWDSNSTTLNYDISKNANYSNSIIFNDKLYVFWYENSKLRYKYLSIINFILSSNDKNYIYKDLLLQQTNSKDFQNIDSLDFLTEKQLTLEQDYDSIITTEDNKKIYSFKLKDKFYQSILEGKCIESGGESDV